MTQAATVREALSRKDRVAFIAHPFGRYAGDPLWVPPLRSSLKAEFDPDRNPFLAHCDHALFLLERGGRVQGRIAALIDRLALEAWAEPIGMFGYFECGEADHEGAAALLGAARAWLSARGMKVMRGPWSFVSQEWGLVIEGFSPRPVVMAPYNPPGYAALLEENGLGKARDLISWEISMPEGYRIPDRILRLTDAIQERHGLRMRRIDMKRYKEEVASFARLSIETLKGNWGFSPITDAEVEAMARDLRPVLRPECVLFATDAAGRDVGFALTIPDINAILARTGGRLFPTGWARLLWGIPRLRRYRMFGLGVDRAWQGKGVDALLYRMMWEELATPDLTMEINYVLEDNWPMVNAIAKLGARPSRRYRVYEAALG
jgi:GNAT superfamily N-acetyltransferase